MKKILSLILCVMLAVSMLPVGALAQEQAAENVFENALALPMPEVAPVEEDIPAVEDAPVVEETPTVEAPPVVEETPAVEETPVVEETAAVEEALAVEENSQDKNGVSLAFSRDEARVNFLYADVLREEDLLCSSMDGRLDGASEAYFYSVDEAAVYVCQELKNRVEEIWFVYEGEADPHAWLCEEIMELAVCHTGIPTEGDYLNFQIGGYVMDETWYYAGETEWNGEYIILCGLTVSYYTTAEEEAVVDQLVDVVMDTFAFTKADTDYKKLLMIYAFICDYVVYDYEHVNDETYLPQYTAYGALVNEEAVCQGYAVLFYRLALEAGIDARVVAGDGGGEGHAWNIVRLGELYYSLDATWDSEYLAEYGDVAWFLRGSNNFTDHEAGGYEGTEFYGTREFWASYPLSVEDFDCYSAVEVIGDVNYDGYVTVADAEEILAYVNGLESVLDEGVVYMVAAAEVNGDGDINSRDAAQILRYIAGLASIYDTF